MSICFQKSKRIFFQFILCNLIVLLSWLSVKTGDLSQKASTIEFRAVLENMRLELSLAGQANLAKLSVSDEDFPYLIRPNLNTETFEISTANVFSRKPEDNAEGQRVVEYSALEQTRIFLAEEEYEILLKIVEAEAGGEDELGRMLVASVVINRLGHESFPNSVKEVVYQKANGTYQFSPVANGRYKRAKVSAETIDAVDKVLAGTDYSEGALFFVSRRAADPQKMRWFDRNLTKLFVHGGHDFFGL